MVDAKHIAESVLKLMGIHPLIDRLMDIATEIIDGEYGSIDDEGLDGVCYSHYSLVKNGKMSLMLEKRLNESNLEFFNRVANSDLDMDIERDSWGSIKLSFDLDVPINPNAKRQDQTFPLDIDIRQSDGDYVISGFISEKAAKANEKYLTLYSLMN